MVMLHYYHSVSRVNREFGVLSKFSLVRDLVNSDLADVYRFKGCVPECVQLRITPVAISHQPGLRKAMVIHNLVAITSSC